MSTGWSSYSGANVSQNGDTEEIPACASCKKRKLRCSRETPTCTHCQRLGTECIYNPKQKPGLKPGAVEALTRRVAFLEKILLDELGNVKPQYNDALEAAAHAANPPVVPTQQAATPDAAIGRPSPGPPQHARINTAELEIVANPNPLKRKASYASVESSMLDLGGTDISQYLPETTILVQVADFFCISFHHWIPFVHKQRLQDRVRRGERSPSFDLMLHALVAVTLRHVACGSSPSDSDATKDQIRLSRYIVETQAARTLSIEGLQAIVLLVFDDLSNGQSQKAWPMVGLLTRTIDYLQLTTEPASSPFKSLMKPLRLVQPTDDWTELEERRRLFWVIFLLDRFCSIHTGWNTSLTADDVHRRLPADGGFFTRQEPVTTPYFGIWSRAAARIGRSLANVPAQYNEEEAPVEQLAGVGASPSSSNGYIDASKLGAFAYCVEATESLSQVTTFFLQQRINWKDKEHAISWLTRFKELDLRLVHWKIFLPPKWKDSNISADQSVIDMDPNLTLAHITHNTSMIMLHHPIAFPPQEWNNYVALPKDCSAQTCELAAVETSNIVQKFLAHTPIPFVNTQFAFCTYVAAKALLYDHRITGRPLRPEFQSLILHLREMSERWKGKHGGRLGGISQAAIYAQSLEVLLDACRRSPHLSFDFYDNACNPPDPPQYTSPVSAAAPQHQHTRQFIQQQPQISGHSRHNSFNSTQSVLSPSGMPSNNAVYGLSAESSELNTNHHGRVPLSATGMPPPQPTAHTMRRYSGHGQHVHDSALASSPHEAPAIPTLRSISGPHNQSLQDQSLLNLSDIFTDAQFLDMDRVITFEDANFFMPYGNV